MAQQLYLKTEVNKSSAQVDGAQQLWKINHTRLQVTRSPEASLLVPHQKAGCVPITYPQPSLPFRGFLTTQEPGTWRPAAACISDKLHPISILLPWKP
jgi:hypothetical protein